LNGERVTLLGIGLIGLGRHGMRYAKHLLEPNPVARLVAVSRRDAAQGLRFAKEHSLRFYDDFRELIADPQVEAVVVVTPPALTKEICLEGIWARKPLLIEKPLALTGADAEAMAAAAERAHVPLMTAQTLRFDPVIQALKEALPTVGSPRYLLLTNRIEPRPDLWRDPRDYGGRGVLLEIGIHLLDLVRFLTDEEINEVRCELDVAEGAESRAWISLRTESNFRCLLDISRVSSGRVSRAEWIGEKGQLTADWARHRFSRLAGNDLEEKTLPDTPTLVSLLQAFVHALQRRTPMPVSGWDGQRAVAIADACYASAATGRPVALRQGKSKKEK
jgi:predicted dehydrogenase